MYRLRLLFLFLGLILCGRLLETKLNTYASNKGTNHFVSKFQTGFSNSFLMIDDSEESEEDSNEALNYYPELSKSNLFAGVFLISPETTFSQQKKWNTFVPIYLFHCVFRL